MGFGFTGPYLEALQDVAQEGVGLQLLDPGVAHRVGALPLAAALGHGKEGVQVEGHEAVGALEPHWLRHARAAERVPQGDDRAADRQVVVLAAANLS